MAFAQRDTGQVAFYARFSDKRILWSMPPLLAAGSIITAHLAALSVEASKMNINGTLRWGIVAGLRCCFWIIALSIG